MTLTGFFLSLFAFDKFSVFNDALLALVALALAYALFTLGF